MPAPVSTTMRSASAIQRRTVAISCSDILSGNHKCAALATNGAKIDHTRRFALSDAVCSVASQNAAGPCRAIEAAAGDDDGTVQDHGIDAGGRLVPVVGDDVRVEGDEVGREPGGDAAAVAQVHPLGV